MLCIFQVLQLECSKVSGVGPGIGRRREEDKYGFNMRLSERPIAVGMTPKVRGDFLQGRRPSLFRAGAAIASADSVIAKWYLCNLAD
jgi:hypothetical protein